MAEIIVEIKKSGETTISVNGVPGPACLEVSKALEESLGLVESRECTVQFYQETPEGQELEQGA